MLLAWASVLSAAEVSFKGGAAYYNGEISNEANRTFFKLINSKNPERLVITSSGGEVEAGIELGTWVNRHGIDIEVPRFCFSSCANYIFTAAKNKYIADGAIVAWHGNYNHLEQTGDWQHDIRARMRNYGEDHATASGRAHDEVRRLASLERDFFELIGVDEYLCWIGKMPPFNVPDYYFLSAEDMTTFGVRNVKLQDNYQATDVSGYQQDIVFISLQDK